MSAGIDVSDTFHGVLTFEIFGKNVHLEMPRKQRRKATGSKEHSGESSAHLSQEISTGKAQEL